MPSNFRANDPYVNEQVDLDDIFISDAWLVDQFVGGTLFTIGYNIYGQLGNGNTLNASSPIQIGSLTNWKQVSASNWNGTGVKTDGTLWTWGFNLYGQLGNGTRVYYSSPIQIGSLTNWKQVSCSSSKMAAIKNDGTLWAWGDNGYGQLGNGTITWYSSPIQIGSLTNWKQVSAEAPNWMAAIKNDGTLWTWGQNTYGGLGNGTTIDYSSPIQIGSLTNWKTVSAGINGNLMAIKTDGTLWACGYNGLGNLGLGSIDAVGNFTTTNTSSPVQVAGGSTWANTDPDTNIITESLGSQTVAIKSDGTLWGWGQNANGELGNGTQGNYYSSPIQIGSLTTWKQVANIIGDPNVNSGQSTAAIKTDGTLWAWGSNDYGIVGNGTVVKYSSPVQVGALTTWKQISGSYYSIHAVKTDGTLWGWGYNNLGKLGNGNLINYSSPIQIGALTNWNQVSGSLLSVAAVKTDGTLWTWGANNSYELGNGTSIAYSSPIQIGSLTNWSKVFCGYSHMTAVKTDGTLWAWGANDYGQLGNGTTTRYSSPIQIGALTNWKQIACGYNSTAAIKTDGTLWTWGRNNFGQLGNGRTVNYSSPIQIGSLTNWRQVSGSKYKSSQFIAYSTSGNLYAWGDNTKGQLGAMTDFTKTVSSPIQVGSLTTWKQVCAGSSSAAAIKTDGTLWTWGYGAQGQLGNGAIVNYSSPVQVGSLTTWKQVVCGYTTLAIKTDGTLWGWGRNNLYGQIGIIDRINYSSPVQVGSLTNWKQVSGGDSTNMAITHTDLG